MLRYVKAAARFVIPSARYWSNVRLPIRRHAPSGRSPNLRGFRRRANHGARWRLPSLVFFSERGELSTLPCYPLARSRPHQKRAHGYGSKQRHAEMPRSGPRRRTSGAPYHRDPRAPPARPSRLLVLPDGTPMAPLTAPRCRRTPETVPMRPTEFRHRSIAAARTRRPLCSDVPRRPAPTNGRGEQALRRQRRARSYAPALEVTRIAPASSPTISVSSWSRLTVTEIGWASAGRRVGSHPRPKAQRMTE
jgi:hypothetical protein